MLIDESGPLPIEVESLFLFFLILRTNLFNKLFFVVFYPDGRLFCIHWQVSEGHEERERGKIIITSDIKLT